MFLFVFYVLYIYIYRERERREIERERYTHILHTFIILRTAPEVDDAVLLAAEGRAHLGALLYIYIYIYIYTYICIYIYIYIYICIYTEREREKERDLKVGIFTSRYMGMFRCLLFRGPLIISLEVIV